MLDSSSGPRAAFRSAVSPCPTPSLARRSAPRSPQMYVPTLPATSFLTPSVQRGSATTVFVELCRPCICWIGAATPVDEQTTRLFLRRAGGAGRRSSRGPRPTCVSNGRAGGVHPAIRENVLGSLVGSFAKRLPPVRPRRAGLRQSSRGSTDQQPKRCLRVQLQSWSPSGTTVCGASPRPREPMVHGFCAGLHLRRCQVIFGPPIPIQAGHGRWRPGPVGAVWRLLRRWPTGAAAGRSQAIRGAWQPGVPTDRRIGGQIESRWRARQ